MSSERDEERVAVRTYVPRYQKELWADEAEDLNMSQSEFVRSMVQAGRREFSFDTTDQPAAESASSGTNPGGQDLEARVLDLLRDGDPRDWDELVEGLTGDIETRLEETLATLQSEGRVIYAGRQGGYVVTDGR
ncbi:DUF5805 domain-containing protein [Natronomonas sp. EA1]|uniref:DUF5805 domain-containing protein n=1 Tax=Natronomonas sp. EA1 TaxID=3421655 RepID=UPI003EC11373